MILRGVVACGLGKAAGFTQIHWVSRQLEEKLDIRPFPGTLNVRLVQPGELDHWERLKSADGIPLDEPDATNCVAVCYPVLVNECLRGAILLPGVAGYPFDQVEVVASESIRRQLGVEDGDAITLQVLEPNAPAA
jgi:riboflavin kinase